MVLSGRHARQILLLSLVLTIIPMILFPERLGTTLVQASLVYMIYEMVFYAVIAFVLTQRSSLVPLIEAAGVCLIYRLVLGATFGLLIAIMYGMNLMVSLTLGLSSYVPAVLLHIVATPFVLTTVLRRISSRQRSSVPSARQELSEAASPGLSMEETLPDRRPAPEPAAAPLANFPEPPERPARRRDLKAPSQPKHTEANGFDRATRYIGEDGTVQVAAVVDYEGLLLGHFQRASHVAEDWAPLALVLFEENQRVLQRAESGLPERLALTLRDRRLVIAREDSFYLMVVAERHNDEVVNVRISQALDIVRKYVAERYGERRSVNAESEYVRSAE